MSLIVAFLCLLPAQQPSGPVWPSTRPERTDYRETSSHQDVLDFLSRLKAMGADFLITSMGTSAQGREIPLVVVSRPSLTTPAEARRGGKVIVYIQANIHGGEVEGKEACLMYLRGLTRGMSPDFLDRLVLLFAPIYNCDGNDLLGPGDDNRPNDNGPDVVGRRPNGMGLDLNRDCMKAESPEMRGALEHVYTRWDPDVILDLHTTNGTRHGYALTYSPPLAPDTEAGVLEFTRDFLLPHVRERMRVQYGLETFDYGNTRPRNAPTGWYTFEPHPRFVTNYAGLRNRIGVLSEATSYYTFRERVEATRHFVFEVLRAVALNADKVIEVTRQADANVASWGRHPRSERELGVRFEPASRGTETVRLEDPEVKGAKGAPTAIVEPTLEVFDRFQATRTRRMPRAYLIPPRYPEAIAVLVRHGIVVERLTGPWKGPVEHFRIESLNTSERIFQGHRLHQLDGTFEVIEEADFPAGSYVVRTTQPLGALIFHLLEPESPDGLGAWGFFDRHLRARTVHPIRKTYSRVLAPAVSVGSG